MYCKTVVQARRPPERWDVRVYWAPRLQNGCGSSTVRFTGWAGRHRAAACAAAFHTWGDRNRDARVCETFVLQEIDRAAALGLDTVQIDDGWQKGTT